jgi:hypothetical protein
MVYATEDRAGDGATLGLEKMGSNATTGGESSNGTDGVDDPAGGKKKKKKKKSKNGTAIRIAIQPVNESPLAERQCQFLITYY